MRLPVITGQIAGCILDVSLFHEKAYWSGRYERDTQALLHALSVPGQAAWDVGAHIGYHTLLLARSGPVVAVEAHPVNAARLRKHVMLNRVAATIVEAAVSDREGHAVLECGPFSGTHRLQGTSGVTWLQEGTGTVLVRTTTLDRLLDRYGPPALVKMDIEGGEIVALQGAPRLLAARPVIVCELHGPEAATVVPALLAGGGYALERDRDWICARPLT